MFNGIKKKERIERTRSGIYHQIEDFMFIIDDYMKDMSEEELKGLYELEEDVR